MILAISFFATGCSSSSDEPTTAVATDDNTSTGGENNTTTCEADQTLVDGVCVDNEPTPTCEANQTLVDGVCVDNEPAPTCEANQTLVDGVCVDNEPASTCEADQTLVDGVCVDNEPAPACDENSTIENGECVDGEIQCNADYLLTDGQCTIDPAIECNDGDTISHGSCEDRKVVCYENFSKDAEGNCVADTLACAFNEVQVVEEETNECVEPENQDITSGTARDGLISGATVTACKVVNGEKSEANATCTDTNSSGEFQCAVRESSDSYEYLIFKVVSGTDIGENVADTRDDRPNVDTLKSVLSSSDVVANKKAFVSPATTLIVLNASNNGYDIGSAKKDIADALNVSEDDMFDETAGIKAGTIVANIIDALGSVDRANAFTILSTKTAIYDENGVVNGLLTELNPSITAESVVSALIKESVDTPSENSETIIDLIADRVDANKTVSETVVANIKTVVEADITDKTNTALLDVVAEVTDLNITKIDKVKEILDATTDDTAASEKIKEEWSNILSITVDDIKSAIGEDTTPTCEANQTLVDGVCVDNNVTEDNATTVCDENSTIENGQCIDGNITCDSGFSLNSDNNVCVQDDEPETPTITCPTGETLVNGQCIVVQKDEVSSPEDVPALPTDRAFVVVPDSFPSIPSDSDYNSTDSLDTNPTTPADNSYPSPVSISGENNSTTPYSVN
jgi:hypothetical protein